MPNHNNKGRRKRGGQFVPIPYNMARSDAWRSLSGPAAKIYIELRTRYNGNNNGDLSLSYGEAADLLSLGRSTIRRAYAELSEKGFLKRTREGHFWGRKAATWAFTDVKINHPRPLMATNDWKRWKPRT